MRTARIPRRLVLLGLIGALALQVQAGVQPPLQGWFQLSEARVESTTTSVTMHLRLFNLRDVDLEQVELRLTSPVMRGEQLASISDVSVPAHDRIQVAAEITIPTPEYQRWLLGATPRFYCVGTANDEVQVLGPIELIRREFVEHSRQGGGRGVEIQQAQPAEESRP